MQTARRHALCIASITTAMPRGLSTLSIVCAISAVILSYNLQPLGERLDQTGEFRNVDYAAVR